LTYTQYCVYSRDIEQLIQALAGSTGSDIRERKRLPPEGEVERETFYLPMHSKELKTGLVQGIKKQLGLK
jgi:hypothetical protein